MDEREFKGKNKILVYVDDEPHYLIRSKGKNTHWMFVPINKSGERKKGLHVARDSKTNENQKHFDIFKDGKKLKGEEEYLEDERIAGIFMNHNGGNFVLPLEYIYLWGSNPKRFYTPEKFKEKTEFRICSVRDLINEGFF